MTTPEIRLSRRESEQLLDDPSAHDNALGWALSAAKAPAHPGELRREDAEVAAFHAARLSPPPASRSNYVSPSVLGRRAAARAVIATGAIVALASGGFALASSTHLPTLLGQASDRATESVARTPKPTETTTSASSATPTEDPAESEETETSEATPTPSFKGLCTAYQAADRSAAGASLDSAAFAALVAEAGGVSQVETYCVALIGEPKETGKPSELPTPTARPTPGKPTDQPTGKPSVLPTPTAKPTPGTSTDKPSGKPTDKPAPAQGGPHN